MKDNHQLDNNISIDEMSYEQARDLLRQILRQLAEPSESLDSSLKLWEEGKALADRCEQILQTAMKRLQASSDNFPDLEKMQDLAQDQLKPEVETG